MPRRPFRGDPSRSHTAGRGYGWSHQLERARWAAAVASGEVTCSRCGSPIGPDQEWHLDHHDDRSLGYRGASHAICNLSAAGRRSGQVRRAQRFTIPRAESNGSGSVPVPDLVDEPPIDRDYVEEDRGHGCRVWWEWDADLLRGWLQHEQGGAWRRTARSRIW